MKVRIVKCSNKNYWYFDKIGRIYDIDDIYEKLGDKKSGLYLLKGVDNLIFKNDCETIEYIRHDIINKLLNE